MWKMNEINREEAVVTLQKQLDILSKDRDQSLILFKMGVLSLDAKIKSLSKQISNINKIIERADVVSFFTCKDYLYVKIPVEVEEYWKEWNGSEWVLQGPKQYSSTGWEKPCIVDLDQPFISSNKNTILNEIESMNDAGSKPITCKDCGTVFGLTPGESAFYRRKELAIPKRCDKCRRRRKSKQ